MKFFAVKRIVTITALTFGCVLILSFQNCAPSSLQFEDLQSTAEAKFFAYPYKVQPKFYASLQLYRMDSTTPGIVQLRVIASASHPSDEALVSYQIRVLGPDGGLVCAPQSGTVGPGSNAIQMDCASSRNPNELKLEMALTSGADTDTIEKDYK